MSKQNLTRDCQMNLLLLIPLSNTMNDFDELYMLIKMNRHHKGNFLYIGLDGSCADGNITKSTWISFIVTNPFLSLSLSKVTPLALSLLLTASNANNYSSRAS